MSALPTLHSKPCPTCHLPAKLNISTSRSSLKDDKLSVLSMKFAVAIIDLVKKLKQQRESIISNQIGRSGTSIGANIRESRYAHSKADFIAKLQIALKEANETGYWLELLYNTKYINDSEYKSLDRLCAEIRVILIASINTAKPITANHDNASFNSVSTVKCLRT